MTDTKMLVGSLSNDMFRVASLAHRGSDKAAQRFLIEAQRWSKDLKNHQVEDYILHIVEDISKRKTTDISEASAEQYLMYGVLLQNYSLQLK